jgi:hypothetical protein
VHYITRYQHVNAMDIVAVRYQYCHGIRAVNANRYTVGECWGIYFVNMVSVVIWGSSPQPWRHMINDMTWGPFPW